MTATPNKYPQKKFKPKYCRWCDSLFEPVAPSHLFCSDDCKDRSYTNSYYVRTYGITLADVEKMLDKQNHLCAICNLSGFKMHEGVWTNLNIDHCHKTGNVRGALCHNCNRALGLFKDNIRTLESAISYLESATTIPEGSTGKCPEARDIRQDDDIVCSHVKA